MSENGKGVGAMSIRSQIIAHVKFSIAAARFDHGAGVRHTDSTNEATICQR